MVLLYNEKYRNVAGMDLQLFVIRKKWLTAMGA